MSRFVCLLVPLLLLSPLVGCSDWASVSGTVTMDGQPLDDAAIVFTGTTGGRPAMGVTDAKGYYTLEYSLSKSGAEPGDYKVSISTAREADIDGEGNDIPGRRESVPVNYNQRTELTATVEKGSNVFDFPLSSEGTIEQNEDPMAEE